MTLFSANVASPSPSTVIINIHEPQATASAPPRNQAEIQLLKCIGLLTNDNIFLPMAKNQALGKSAGKYIAANLRQYEHCVATHEKRFQQAVKSQQRAYQKSVMGQRREQSDHKKNRIGKAQSVHVSHALGLDKTAIKQVRFLDRVDEVKYGKNAQGHYSRNTSPLNALTFLRRLSEDEG